MWAMKLQTLQRSLTLSIKSDIYHPFKPVVVSESIQLAPVTFVTASMIH